MATNLKSSDLVSLRDTGNVQVVDVRSAGEFAAGHLPGAVNIPMDQIESRLPDLSQTGKVVLVCQSGRRAAMTCELLAGKHPELYVLEEGAAGWISAGLPLVKNVRTRWSMERQTRFGAGILVLVGTLLGAFVNPLWLILSGFVGAGLTFAGLTDICGMAYVLGLMPWNKPVPAQVSVSTTAEASS